MYVFLIKYGKYEKIYSVGLVIILIEFNRGNKINGYFQKPISNFQEKTDVEIKI